MLGDEICNDAPIVAARISPRLCGREGRIKTHPNPEASARTHGLGGLIPAGAGHQQVLVGRDR
jgi:hypothetical protein